MSSALVLASRNGGRGRGEDSDGAGGHNSGKRVCETCGKMHLSVNVTIVLDAMTITIRGLHVLVTQAHVR